MLLSVLLWFGFYGTGNLEEVLWKNAPFNLYLVNMGYNLVALIIAGGIMGA